MSKAGLEPLRLGIQQIDKALWMEGMWIQVDWQNQNCTEPPNFEFGTESCVIEATAAGKVSATGMRSNFLVYTATPKKGCDYLRKMMAEHNKTVTESVYKFCLDRNTTLKSQLDDFQLYEWDFDPDMDHHWPDFFIRKTKEGSCPEYDIEWDCRRPIF